MGTILIIDDNAAFLDLIRDYVRQHHPALTVLTCSDPVTCLPRISTDLDLLLVDLEMPGLDGIKVLEYAKTKGLSKNRIIVLSGRDADYLHRRIPLGSCLAVLNKDEARQKEVLDMVFTSLERGPAVHPALPPSMPVSQEYLDYLVDQLRPLGQVAAKRMFGGAGLYHKGAFFGLVADDVLYFKADEESRKDYLDAGSRPFKPFGTYAMGYFEVPADVVEDPDELVLWALKAVAASRKKMQKKSSSAGDGKKRVRKSGKKAPKKD